MTKMQLWFKLAQVVENKMAKLARAKIVKIKRKLSEIA